MRSNSFLSVEPSHRSVNELPASAGWGRLIWLGVAGGIVPCWDAVILLGFAISSHQLWLGVPLLLAFSAGLAAVLVALGLAVVYGTKLGAARFRERRWFKALPIISAVVVIVIGAWLCRDSQRPKEDKPPAAHTTAPVASPPCPGVPA